MNKKIIIPIAIVFVFVLIAAGIFWWQKREIKGSPDDYVIKETAEGTIVENKKAGLTVKVPEGWKAEKKNIEEGLIVFYSPDIKRELQNNKINPPLKEVCIIHTSVTYEEMDFASLKLQARYNLALLDVKSVEFEEVGINDYRALKTTADTQKIGPVIGIDVPHKDRTYSFLLIFTSKGKEICLQEFDNFLETVSIK